MNIHSRALALALIVALAVANAASAAVVVGLVLDPATTAGTSPGVDSTYSGLGTWHLFAVDDNADDFGISTYNIHLSGATAIHNASPKALGIRDINGDYQQAGFDLLRSPDQVSATDSIHAALPLPDQSPFHITGLGQEASNFATKVAAVQPGATVMDGGTSPSWGNYSTISPLNGKNWLFLAEGAYDVGAPPVIDQARFTVYTDQTTFRSGLTTAAIVPEPITPTLLTPEYLAHLTAPLLPTPAPVEPVHVPEPAPPVVASPPVEPANPPTHASQVPQETPPRALPFDPPINIGEWTVIEDPNNTGEYTNSFIFYTIDPTDPASVTFLPFGYAHPWVLQAAMATNVGEMSSQAIFGIAGEDIQVDPSWAPMAKAIGVGHDGIDIARFGIARATGSDFFDSQAMQDAAPAPEPAGLFLMAVAQSCLLLVARVRRR